MVGGTDIGLEKRRKRNPISIDAFRMSSIGQPQISIHLMFILIKETCAQLDAFFGFQYISCLY